MQWTLRHIGWIAATETGLTQQPDLNRFIQLHLLKAKAEKKNQLVIPGPQERYKLGQKLLAIAVRYAIASKKLAMDLKTTAAEGIDARVVESHAVPVAIMATACGIKRKNCSPNYSRALRRSTKGIPTKENC